MITGILLLVYVTRISNAPDWQGSQEMTTIEDCEAGAKDWLRLPIYQAAKRLYVPEKDRQDIKGLAATCELNITGDEE